MLDLLRRRFRAVRRSRIKAKLEKLKRSGSAEAVNDGQAGYTLVEVMMTVFIMGLVLIMVNMVLLAMVRATVEADSRMKIRQGIDLSLEVMNRNIKSSEPQNMILQNRDGQGGWVECSMGQQCDRVVVALAESSWTVAFYMEEDGEEIGVVKAYWLNSLTGYEYISNLTSFTEMDVGRFDVQARRDLDSGTTEVVLTIEADSLGRRANGDPIVDDYYKQRIVVAKGMEI